MTRLPLAVLGATPRFASPLHVGAPNVADRTAFYGRLDAVFDRNRLTNGGPEEQELEAAVARRAGVRHAVAVVNATTALQILARALDWRGEVLVPSFTFVATAHALAWLGLEPVFCDVDPRTHNIDPADVERRLTGRTAAILGVHLWGRPCDVDALARIAAAHRIDLVVDAAQAWGCTRAGVPVGGSGRAEVFSFHATKWMHGFEGGAITTNDDDLAARCQAMKRFGFTDYDHTDVIGTNATMMEPAAAMALVSMQSESVVLARNAANFTAYAAGVKTLPGVTLLRPFDGDAWHHHYVVLEMDDTAPLTRDELQRVLWAENVLARRYFHPGCHRLRPYCDSRPARAELPVTEWLARRTLALPTGLQMEPEAASATCDIIRTAFQHAPEVRARL